MPALASTSFETFAEDVIASSQHMPVLVDLWAAWCSPCLVIAPVLEQIAEEFVDELQIYKLEVDAGENMRIAGQYQARGFPTVILFQHGAEQARFHGAKPFGFIEEFLLQHAEFGN